MDFTQFMAAFALAAFSLNFLIGVGGIASGVDAYAKIRAGASLIQLYSSLIYKGLSLVHTIKNDLASTLLRTGRTSLSEIVGADAASITAEDWPI